MNVKSMSVRNERDQEVTEGLQIRGRGSAVKKAYTSLLTGILVNILVIENPE